MTKKIFAIAATAFLLAGCDSADVDLENDAVVENLPSDEEIEAVLESIAAPEENDGDVIASCNAIVNASTCIDYVGSMWTKQIIELGCTGEEGMAPSDGACPTGAVGGCRIGADTASEMVTWFYNYGGDPIDAETEPYAAGACNATMGSHWVGAN